MKADLQINIEIAFYRILLIILHFLYFIYTIVKGCTFFAQPAFYIRIAICIETW